MINLGTPETNKVAQPQMQTVDSCSTEETETELGAPTANAATAAEHAQRLLPKRPSPSWFRVRQMVDISWLEVSDMVQYFNQQHEAVVQRNTQRASASASGDDPNRPSRSTSTKIRRKRQRGKGRVKEVPSIESSNLDGTQQPEAALAGVLPSSPLPNLVEPEPEEQHQQQKLQETIPPDFHLPPPPKDLEEPEEKEEDEELTVDPSASLPPLLDPADFDLPPPPEDLDEPEENKELTVDPPSPPLLDPADFDLDKHEEEDEELTVDPPSPPPPPLVDPRKPEEEEDHPTVPPESESHGEPLLGEETPFDERSTGSCPPSHPSVVSLEGAILVPVASIESLQVSDPKDEKEEEEEPSPAPVKSLLVTDPEDAKQQQETQEPSPQLPDTAPVESLEVSDEQEEEEEHEPDGAPKERLRELDVAFDEGLQESPPLPDMAIEKRRVLEELGMNSSIPGKAWNLVESAQAMQTKDIQTLAADGIVLLAERLFQTQEELRRQNAPCFVDIAYHHTRSENLKTIQTEGLLSRSERKQQRIRSRTNGSTYGDGVYCSSDPVAFAGQHYGDTTILLARIKGNNSIIVPSRKLCILDCGSQCVPLFRFPSKLLGSDFAATDAPICQFRQDLAKFHEQVQSRLLDKFFNTDPSLHVKGVHCGWESDRVTLPGRSSLQAFLDANRGCGNTIVTNAAVAGGQTIGPAKIQNTDTSPYEVYVRADGKKIRRLKKNLIGAALGRDTVPSKDEIYVRADGKKVRRVKKQSTNTTSVCPDGTLDRHANKPKPISDEIYTRIDGKKKVRRVRRTTASATAEKPKALTEFVDVEIYTRADGKKVRRIRKASSEENAITRPNCAKPPETSTPTHSSSGYDDPYVHNFPSMLGLEPTSNFPSMLGLEPPKLPGEHSATAELPKRKKNPMGLLIPAWRGGKVTQFEI